MSRARQDIEARLEALATDLLQVAGHRDAAGKLEPDKAAVDIARAVSQGGTEARHDLIARLADAIRGLDEATTLRSTLEVLAYGASAAADRVAVMIVDDEGLHCWAHHGFSAGRGPVDVPLDVSEILAASVKLRQVSAIPPVEDRPDPTLPAFMRVAKGRIGMAFPVVVAGEVVALVFADGPDRRTNKTAGEVWTEQVDVLVRHAASRLENLTTRRAVEVLAGED